MRIGSRSIGAEHPPYIIAELGVNHDGSVARALEMTRAAARAGANAVKLQLFRADLLMGRASRLADYQAGAGERDPREMLRRLELSISEMNEIVSLAHELGIDAIVTVFSLELVDPAAGLAWDAFKTASPDIINDPLLDALAATGRPLIVSTGAAEMEEVRRAVGRLERSASDRFAVLQCVSSYPTPPERASIGGMLAIAMDFTGPVGYSDHTEGVGTGAIAVRYGACILEKHLTHSRLAQGPDHAASLEGAAFREYVELARAAHEARRRGGAASTPMEVEVGPIEKRVLDIEVEVRAVSRQSVTAVRDLPVGHVLARADVTLKRPGLGLPPSELTRVVGRRLGRRVEVDAALVAEDLAPLTPVTEPAPLAGAVR